MIICFTLTLLFVLIPNCTNRQNNPEAESVEKQSTETSIDSRSYNLGGIGAFAEVVDIGIKKLVLSAPLPPEEMDALIDDALRIAENNNVKIYREEDFLITDLFPAEITRGKHVLLIYKDPVKQEYLKLKANKRQLVQSDQYKGAARETIARSLGKLLSYPKEKIDALLNESENQ